MKLYSLGRQSERYVVIYILKIVEGLAPDSEIKSYANRLTERHCTITEILVSPSSIRTQYCNSLDFKGSQLFNILANNVRDLRGANVEVFKKRLDKIFHLRYSMNRHHDRKSCSIHLVTSPGTEQERN